MVYHYGYKFKGLTIEGSESNFPPIGWWSLDLKRRDNGSGWSNNLCITQLLCPECANQITNLLNIMPTPPKLSKGEDK
jgi:hypothetical protein